MTKSFQTVFIALLIGTWTILPVRGNETPLDGDSLCYQVWKLIENDYYDPGLHGQDWNTWKSKFQDKKLSMADAHSVIKEMVSSLNDPFTKIIDAREYRALQIEWNKKFEPDVGIGVAIAMTKDRNVAIVRILKGGSAFESHAVEKDFVIVDVDGKNVDTESPYQISERIRGPVDTYVTITFLDKEKNRKTVKLQRRVLPRPDEVYIQRFEDVGYIFILPGVINPSRQLRERFAELKGCKSIVLDIRENNSLNVAGLIGISSMFVPRGTLLCLALKGEKIDKFTAIGDQLFSGKLVTLIDTKTSGHAVALASALSEAGGSKLVGETTSRAGNITNLKPLLDGSALFLTIGKWHATNHASLSTGVEPDVVVKSSFDDFEHIHWWLKSIGDENRQPTLDDIQLRRALELAR